MSVEPFLKNPAFGKVLKAVLLVVALGTLSACQAIYRNHGYIPTPEDLAEVTVGVDTRATVAENIGAPSSSGVLNDSGYYYVTTRVRQSGAAKPKVISRTMVAISFDQRGVVRNIERFGLEKGQLVAIERRVTSSSVENKTFLRQLLGSLGNINPGTVFNQ